MPLINWPNVADASEFTPVPEGKYKVKITDVEGGTTKSSGDEMWTVELTITLGQYVGRKIIDRFVFSEKGVGRVKLALKSIGQDVSKEREVRPVDIIDGECFVDVIIDEQIVRKPGQEPKTYRNNKVTFAGYSAIDAAHVPQVENEDGDDLPF